MGSELEESVDLEPVKMEKPKLSSNYYKWMGGPFILLTTAAISILDQSYGSIAWASAIGWSLSVVFFTFMWFHEFVKGGPQEKDLVFDDYNLTAKVGYTGLAMLTAWGRYSDSTHPSSFVANVVSVVFGFWYTSQVEKIYHSDNGNHDDATQADMQYKERQAGL